MSEGGRKQKKTRLTLKEKKRERRWVKERKKEMRERERVSERVRWARLFHPPQKGENVKYNKNWLGGKNKKKEGVGMGYG